MPIQVSQFSDSSIPFETAASLCGPAAAIAFARANGRNPSLQEAQKLAEGVGWTAGAGMAGPQSQQALLTKMGVESDLTPDADWGRVTADVRGGKPVIISTPRHYFTVSQADPVKGFYVGTSGTDLKGGSEWMTAEQITKQGQGVNGALYLKGGGSSVEPVPADAPPSPLTPEPVQDPRTPQIKQLQRADAYSRRLMAQFPEPAPLPSYQLPGLPKVEMGWGEPYTPGRRRR